MIWRQRLASVLLVLGGVVAIRQGQELFHSYVYADELTRLDRMVNVLEEDGVQVVRTRMRADSLRAIIEEIDRELVKRKEAVSAYDRHVSQGALPSRLYTAYRRELDAYNRRVMERNQVFERWKAVVVENHAAVGRYNSRADTIRALADRIGEPYFRIPSPVEAAAERGILDAGGKRPAGES
jgi:hypothetical protein